MTVNAAYPQAIADADNRHFLEEWREGRLAFQACGSCGRKFFYARPLCPHCWSDALAWEAAGGEGEVVSYSLVYRPNHPSFLGEVPIALAEIRLREGVTLLARVVGAAPESLRSGMSVRLLSKSEAGRYPLPTFRPRQSGPGHDR